MISPYPRTRTTAQTANSIKSATGANAASRDSLRSMLDVRRLTQRQINHMGRTMFRAS